MKWIWPISAAMVAVASLAPAGLALTPLPSDAYLTKQFRQADADGDGRLNRTEYLGMWKYDREHGNRQFLKLDKNRDSFISLDEYLAPIREMRQKQQFGDRPEPQRK